MIPLTSLAWPEVEGEDGVVRKVPMVPSWGMVLEYLIKSSTGHPSTPKGGTPEYRNGPQYKLVYGVPQGERMGEKKRYGYGSYAEKKMRFVTIEQTWTAIKMWYDVELQDCAIANPARNMRLKKVCAA